MLFFKSRPPPVFLFTNVFLYLLSFFVLWVLVCALPLVIFVNMPASSCLVLLCCFAVWYFSAFFSSTLDSSFFRGKCHDSHHGSLTKIRSTYLPNEDVDESQHSTNQRRPTNDKEIQHQNNSQDENEDNKETNKNRVIMLLNLFP